MNETRPDPAPVRDAATLVLLRPGRPETGGAPEVLMVQRPRGAVFMADAHVFPGGRLEPGDGGDFALAAAREAFEEAGVLFAVDEQGAPAATEGVEWIAAGRLAVARGEISFSALLAAHGLRADTSAFIHFARWITPPSEPRRFDARFFFARMPDGQQALPDAAGEIADFRWDTAHRLIAAQALGRIKLPPPTLYTLGDLALHRTVDEAAEWARTRTIIPIRPKLTALGESLAILLPWDADYATAPVPFDDGEPLPADSPVAGPISRYVVEDGLWVPRSRRA